MSIITLTTDWSTKGFYVSALKGQLLCLLPTANIIDICHEISPFNVAQAAFIVKNSYKNFPKGTIHVIGVNSEHIERAYYLAVYADEQFFIVQDNGIVGLLFDTLIEKIVRIDFSDLFGSLSFNELSFITYAISQIIQTNDIITLGPELPKFKKQFPLQPVIEDSVILGRILFVDSYGNAITNIQKEIFYYYIKNRKFLITILSNRNKITRISKTYSDENAGGELLALFNSINLLEIAIYNGNVSKILNLNTDSSVRIDFI